MRLVWEPAMLLVGDVSGIQKSIVHIGGGFPGAKGSTWLQSERLYIYQVQVRSMDDVVCLMTFSCSRRGVLYGGVAPCSVSIPSLCMSYQAYY